MMIEERGCPLLRHQSNSARDGVAPAPVGHKPIQEYRGLTGPRGSSGAKSPKTKGETLGHSEGWRWYDGTRDPVDSAVRNVEPAQVRDPRASSIDRGETRQLLIADDLVVEINDPLQLMLDCERLDEVDGCERGTHYDELQRRSREKLSR